MKCVIADTGPLVAIHDRDDQDHAWAVREGSRLPPKMISCEAVLSEVHFLTRDIPEAKLRIESWLADGRLELPFHVGNQHTAVHDLMARYANVPMSFADACLVRMSELWHEDRWRDGCALRTNRSSPDRPEACRYFVSFRQ